MSFLTKSLLLLVLSSCSIAMMQNNAPIEEEEEIENDFSFPKVPKFPKL